MAAKITKAINISQDHNKKLEEIRDQDRKFNLSERVEELIDKEHEEKVRPKKLK